VSDWKQDWRVCHQHKLKWRGDYGTFTPQEVVLAEMDGGTVEQYHAANLAILAQCREVTPFCRPPTLQERLRERVAGGNNAIMGWIADKTWRLAMRVICWANRRRGYRRVADVVDKHLFAEDRQTVPEGHASAADPTPAPAAQGGAARV
jgi:hypothetical protein